MSTRDNNVPSPGEHPLQISQWFAAGKRNRTHFDKIGAAAKTTVVPTREHTS